MYTVLIIEIEKEFIEDRLEEGSLLLFRQKRSRQPLGLRHLRGGHRFFHPFPRLGRTYFPIRRREIEPHVCENIILNDAVPGRVQHAQMKLRRCVLPLRRFSEPFRRFPVAPPNALSLVVHPAQVELRFPVSRFRGDTKFFQGDRKIILGQRF